MVFLALLAVSFTAFFVVRHAIDEQERRLLRERTGEVALLLDNTVTGVSSALAPLGVAARFGESPTSAFLKAASAGEDDDGGGTQMIALVRRAGAELAVVAVHGSGLQPGDFLSGARKEAVERALSSPGLSPTPVFQDASRSRLGFALGPPQAPPGHVVYQETIVAPAALSVTQERPFRELDAALYAAPRAEAEQLVLTTTTKLPLQGDVATDTIDVGADRWQLAVSARESLIGSFAGAVPWILLGVGIVGAAGASGLVLALQRRRDFALALVAERTAELKRSLAELEEAQGQLVLQERLAAIGRVAAAVGHELRNPLGVLTNALFLIRSRIAKIDGIDAEETTRMERHLGTAEREIAAAVVIVESLLDYARNREPVPAPVDLADLIEESLSVAPPPQGVEIVRDGIDAAPAVNADRQQLRQVLLNLLTNGYEAMDGEGVLTIAADLPNGSVRISVSDTGAGMDGATAVRAFEPFFTGKAKGIGLGLAVSKRIVEAHGGTIVGASNDGPGATFALTLPVAPTAAAVEGIG